MIDKKILFVERLKMVNLHDERLCDLRQYLPFVFWGISDKTSGSGEIRLTKAFD